MSKMIENAIIPFRLKKTSNRYSIEELPMLENDRKLFLYNHPKCMIYITKWPQSLVLKPIILPKIPRFRQEESSSALGNVLPLSNLF